MGRGELRGGGSGAWDAPRQLGNGDRGRWLSREEGCDNLRNWPGLGKKERSNGVEWVLMRELAQYRTTFIAREGSGNSAWGDNMGDRASSALHRG